MAELRCKLCECSETDRPLFEARFNGSSIHVCPKCMPTLIHGLTSKELKQVLGEKLAARG